MAETSIFNLIFCVYFCFVRFFLFRSLSSKIFHGYFSNEKRLILVLIVWIYCDAYAFFICLSVWMSARDECMVCVCEWMCLFNLWMCVEKSHIQKQIFEKDRNNSKVKWKIVNSHSHSCVPTALHCIALPSHHTTVIVVDALLFKQ